MGVYLLECSPFPAVPFYTCALSCADARRGIRSNPVSEDSVARIARPAWAGPPFSVCRFSSLVVPFGATGPAARGQSRLGRPLTSSPGARTRTVTRPAARLPSRLSPWFLPMARRLRVSDAARSTLPQRGLVPSAGRHESLACPSSSIPHIVLFPFPLRGPAFASSPGSWPRPGLPGLPGRGPRPRPAPSGLTRDRVGQPGHWRPRRRRAPPDARRTGADSLSSL